MGRQDRWRHGCRHRAPMDGFTACPACPCRPANPRNASFCCCRCLGLKHLQVQGAALPKNTHKKTAGRGLLFRCNGAPGEIRTPDRLVRSQVLYPTELRARGTQSTYCLILLHFQRRMLKTCRVVRPERFELPTAWFVARYSIQLSYGRQLHKLVVLTVYGAPGEIRTPDRLVRSQVLYPTELRAPCDRSGIMRMSARTVNSFVKIFIQLNEKAVSYSLRRFQPREMIGARAQFLRGQHTQLRVHIR